MAAWGIEFKAWIGDSVYLVSKLRSSTYLLYDLGQDYLSQWFTMGVLLSHLRDIWQYLETHLVVTAEAGVLLASSG